jgi:hypothetical protein
MFALAALLSFVLALFKVVIGIDLVVLGFVLISLHLLFGSWPLTGSFPWRKTG